jgi:hypothetical protein
MLTPTRFHMLVRGDDRREALAWFDRVAPGRRVRRCDLDHDGSAVLLWTYDRDDPQLREVDSTHKELVETCSVVYDTPPVALRLAMEKARALLDTDEIRLTEQL